MKTASNTSGVLLATAVAALFANAPVMAAEQSGQEAKVHCGGINACKGKSECATANNACKGANACKGQGFVTVSAKECTEKGGKVLPNSGM